MDYKTKAHYRNKIKEISKRTKISELYITQKALELAQTNTTIPVGAEWYTTQQINNQPNANNVWASSVSAQQVNHHPNEDTPVEGDALIDPKTKNKSNVTTNKKSHIGYYLIAEGITELYKTLQTNKKPKREKNNVPLYILSITILAISISALISYYIFKQTNIVLGIITFLLTCIPSSQISTDIIQYLLSKTVKPSLIPKMDFSMRNTRRMFYNGYNSKHSKITKQSKRLNFKARSFLPCK